MLNSFWKNKKVLLTGHTGFKGSWASLWLLNSGAELTGFSLGLPTKPSLFEELKIENNMRSLIGDIRDIEAVKNAVQAAKPEIVIHMAAQPLVRYSYSEPVETYMTNVMGAVHLFEACRKFGSVKAIVNVTSDKCYENKERKEGYREDEAMGGYDPYSNSKGCSELVTAAYRSSFFSKLDISIGSGRAGNVIGGGDWAQDRLVPDIVRSVLKNETLEIRNPRSTRPWQHVLEPVFGYFVLAEKLFTQGQAFASGYNFGPQETDHCDVEQIITKMNKYWNNKIQYRITKSELTPHEANYLSLNCEKSRKELSWFPRWDVDQALQMTVEWHQLRLNNKAVRDICEKQISQYES